MSRAVSLSAKMWRAAGFSVVPAREDGIKSPALASWKDYTRELPSEAEVAGWVTEATENYGLICGNVSGGLEMFEFEGRAVAEGWLTDFEKLVADNGMVELWERVWDGYREVTPTGGIHLLYRVVMDGEEVAVEPAAAPNTKLASRPMTPEELAAANAERQRVAFVEGRVHRPAARAQLVMIETRGEGGFTMMAPSSGAKQPSGKDWVRSAGIPGLVPVITVAERDRLFAVAAMLDRMPVREVDLASVAGADGGPNATRLPWEAGRAESPLDDFETRTDWSDILEPHGWTQVKVGPKGERYWRRPGKDAAGNGGAQGYAWSASTGMDSVRDRLWVWSTSTEFETEVSITKGWAYAALNHDGNASAAATSLRAMGFGRSGREGDRQAVADWTAGLEVKGATERLEGGRVESPKTEETSKVVEITTNHFINESAGDAESGVRYEAGGLVEVEDANVPEELAACFLSDAFWAARPLFGVIRQAAQSKMESPEGVLVSALAACVARTMPNIVLPACVGVEASLNLMTVAVGAAGEGKSACRKVAKAVVKFAGCDDVWEFPPSSGQGIAGQYQALRKPKGGEPYMEAVRWNALAIVEESDRIAALAANASSTLSSELRAAAMGELIGSANVGDTKTNMPEGSYRFVLAMCMQPELSGWLLDEKAGGLPQRFLWFCVKDPRISEGVVMPGQWTITLPLECSADPVSGAPRSQFIMGVTDRICAEIRAAKIERKRAIGRGVVAGEEYDGHITLLRLKVAGGLALMDGRLSISDEDWDLAGAVVAASKATIRYTQGVQAVMAGRKSEAARKVKVADAKAIKVVETETVENTIKARTAASLLRKLQRQGPEGETKGALRATLTAGQREVFGCVLDGLLAAGQVRFEDTFDKHGKQNGSRWFKV